MFEPNSRNCIRYEGTKVLIDTQNVGCDVSPLTVHVIARFNATDTILRWDFLAE
jgi:hypothetical protein